jgi:hypothetical protein
VKKIFNRNIRLITLLFVLSSLAGCVKDPVASPNNTPEEPYDPVKSWRRDSAAMIGYAQHIGGPYFWDGASLISVVNAGDSTGQDIDDLERYYYVKGVNITGTRDNKEFYLPVGTIDGIMPIFFINPSLWSTWSTNQEPFSWIIERTFSYIGPNGTVRVFLPSGWTEEWEQKLFKIDYHDCIMLEISLYYRSK